MEKNHDLPVDENHEIVTTPRHDHRRLVFTRDNRITITLIFVIASCLWLSHIIDVFPRQHTACSRPLSVQERATNILKENPLIGESYRADTTSCADRRQMVTMI
jgi:hypothetical protein